MLTLNAYDQSKAIETLSSSEPSFHHVIEAYGPPPMWNREQGFPTLIRIILEQQVSLASAQAAFERLLVAAEDLSPSRFLAFRDDELKTIGFSRQKTRYGRSLALALEQGELDLVSLECLPDDKVRSELMRIKGIGTWTANIYLLMALQRPDVWPRGDIALAGAYQQLKGLSARPSNEDMQQISMAWAPWRSVAARLLWHYYLSEKELSI